MLNARPAAHEGRCAKNGCAHPKIVPGDLIAHYKKELMHGPCANLCNGTLREYAEHEQRLEAFRLRHRAEVTKHRVLLHETALKIGVPA